MATSHKPKRLKDAYSFPGFRAQDRLRGIFGDPGPVTKIMYLLGAIPE
jgi:hypothetical protein